MHSAPVCQPTSYQCKSCARSHDRLRKRTRCPLHFASRNSPLCSGTCFLSYIHWIIGADDSVNDWSSDDESERQLCNDSSLNIEPARGARLPQRSQRRPARKTLPFVPYADWVPDQSYDELPPSCMHYIMEWKLTRNRRVAAKQTEDDLVVAPSDF
jgi:hypothetical protein